MPRVVGRRLRRAPGCAALLLSEVRRQETVATAVRELALAGLSVAAYQVVNGREIFEVTLDPPPPVGAYLLLVATFGMRAPTTPGLKDPHHGHRAGAEAAARSRG